MGNKRDLNAEREVSTLEAANFAQENGKYFTVWLSELLNRCNILIRFYLQFFIDLMFVETSALSGENIHEAFLKCTRTIFNRIENGEIDVERIGSGIQYGDVASRNNFQRTNNLYSSNNRRDGYESKRRGSNCSSSICN